MLGIVQLLLVAVLILTVWLFGVSLVQKAIENRKDKKWNESGLSEMVALLWPISLPLWGLLLIFWPLLKVVVLKPMHWLASGAINLGDELADKLFPKRKPGQPKGTKNKSK